jgi:hypothetical protein
MTHPLACWHPSGHKSGGNCGAWNEVHAGDRIFYLIDGRTGTLDECLHDGEAFVTWDDGTYETVNWYHLAPAHKVRTVPGGWECKQEYRT